MSLKKLFSVTFAPDVLVQLIFFTVLYLFHLLCGVHLRYIK